MSERERCFYAGKLVAATARRDGQRRAWCPLCNGFVQATVYGLYRQHDVAVAKAEQPEPSPSPSRVRASALRQYLRDHSRDGYATVRWRAVALLFGYSHQRVQQVAAGLGIAAMHLTPKAEQPEPEPEPKPRLLPPLVLGIDAASYSTGLALLDGPTPVALGVVSAPAPLLADRLGQLLGGMDAWWGQHGPASSERPWVAAIELAPYMPGRPGQAEVYAAAGMAVAWAWGLRQFGVQVCMMPLARWKAAIVRGSGTRASKDEVRAALLLRYPALRTHPAMRAGSKSDASDALGVATAWLDEWEFASRGQEPPPAGRIVAVRKSAPRKEGKAK